MINRAINCGEVKSVGEYVDLAKRRGLLAADGKFLIVANVGSSRNFQNILGANLVYPNRSGYFFTSLRAAENYLHVCGESEVDFCRSGGFVARRI